MSKYEAFKTLEKLCVNTLDGNELPDEVWKDLANLSQNLGDRIVYMAEKYSIDPFMLSNTFAFAFMLLMVKVKENMGDKQ